MKSHSQYICQQCGYKSPSYLGKCPNCDTWNSLVETVERDEKGPSWSKAGKRERGTGIFASKLDQIRTAKVSRLSSGISEFDQVVGGGLVPGSVILLAGDPGIGKSTLTFQILSFVGGLYVSGEESAEQVKLRAERLKLPTRKILILPETNVEAILDEADKNRKDIVLVIIDSIQTLWSQELTGIPGAVGQVRESTLKLLNFAKREHLSIILIGHVTKEGTIAGPKTLEHIVDTVLYLEGERYQSLRLLRTSKNRFGPVDEVGVGAFARRRIAAIKKPRAVRSHFSHKGICSAVVR